MHVFPTVTAKEMTMATVPLFPTVTAPEMTMSTMFPTAEERTRATVAFSEAARTINRYF